ncbi:MAG: gliding motility-associated C-terminal domain-containing protein [Bacteroidales bacterium]|nr:gliding motility-associated C-terminal domain-containing protein [Bacteroidales bacterium]MCB8998732.1 gliding motility-associated C-terminal domain-containing protein [Bacteroidales bacterium]
MKAIQRNIKTGFFSPLCTFHNSAVVLCLVLMFFSAGDLYSQVISNSGAVIELTGGVNVESKDFDNNSGIIANEGVINLEGNFLNTALGTSGGNGFYNLRGNWSNFGLFNPGTSTVTFNGFANQTINHGSIGEKFYKLTINNPGNSVTQIANPASSLTVLNQLRITAGTLQLGPTTTNLLVGGKTTIFGSLSFDGTTVQTGALADTLEGTGTIDMSGGSLPHLLNLSGASNAIGTFTTSPVGSSTVDYLGTDQTVFGTPNYRNLRISNSGTKVLQGNSIVGEKLDVAAGTFDLGTVPTSLSVLGLTTITGTLSFDDISTKTVSLGDNLSGLGIINMSGSALPHLLNLYGTANSIGTYNSGSGSIVDYIRNGDQDVFISNNYRNLRISGSGVKTLNDTITASGVLTMLSGDINSNGNVLKLINDDVAAIVRTSGTVIGKLQRAVSYTGSEYFYPLGSSSFYNPMNIKFYSLVPGALTAQFKAEDIGNVGLPLDDDGDEVYEQFTEGYWNLSAVAPMASSNYYINLNYNGFPAVDSSDRVIKRTDGGPLELDGVNGGFNGSFIERDSLTSGISTNAIDFGIGKGRPKIKEQPQDTSVCEGTNAFFEVKAKGHGRKLTYQWQVDTGGGFVNVLNGGVYSGATTKRLELTAVPFSMNGYIYRVIVTDGSNNSNISFPAVLTVNKVPIATATPDYQEVCDSIPFIDVMLGTSNGVTGTTFDWFRDNPAGIVTTVPMSQNNLNIGDIISGKFINSTDHPITVTFTVTPTGPYTTFCQGDAIQFKIVVQPTPRIFPIPGNLIQCDSSYTYIKLESPTTFTTGVVTFKYTASATGGVTGFLPSQSGLPLNHLIADFLVNPTTSVQRVTYVIRPENPYGCNDGPVKVVTVDVNPTPRLNAVLTGINYVCDTASIDIGLTTGNPTIIGDRWYYLQTNYSGSVSGVMETGYYPLTTNISDVLVNNTKDIQTINYRIKPVFLNVGGVDPSCERGVDTLITIHLNPTPVFDSIVVSDTVICNETTIHFDFYNTQITSGTVVYELVGTYSPADLSGVKPDGPYNFDSFTDTLNNTSLVLQNVTYLFKPIIDDPGHGLYCDKGIHSSKLVKVAPTLLAPATPSTWIGGRNIRCFGENNGSINIAPQGGYYPGGWSYTWTKDGVAMPEPGLQDQDSLTIGKYKYTVNDIIGCSFTDSLTLTQPDLLFANDSIKTVSCEGALDGEIYLDVFGGTPAYNYTWVDDDGALLFTKDITGLRFGYHRLTLKDQNICTFTAVYELVNPSPVLINQNLSNYGNYNISCKGNSDGSINLFATGTGNPLNYQYIWISDKAGVDPKDTSYIDNLVAANYNIKVIDSLNCEGSKWISLVEPEPISITRTGSQYPSGFDISCFGRNDGSIQLSYTGGHTDYLPSFSDWTMLENGAYSDTMKNISGLYKGTYSLNVLDAFGCQKDTFFTLYEPDEMILDTVSISDWNGYNVSCKNSNNSSLDLNLTGGSGSYLFNWTSVDGLVTTPGTLDQTDLPAGNYHLDVTDSYNCPAQWDIEITEPDTIAVNPVIPLHNGYEVSCFEGADGALVLGTNGGVAPYQFSWSSSDGSGLSALSENQTGLSAGTYSVVVTDLNNCIASWDYVFTQPTKLLTNIVPTTISCFSINNGSADLEVTGGVPAYTYIWNNGKTTQDIDSLYTGKYYVDITDANNCVISDTTMVNEPPEIIVSLDAPLQYNGRMISCYGESDASINSTVTGGVGSYRYDWGPDGQQTANISNIPAGLYHLTVTDDNECTREDSITVEEPLKLVTEVFEVNPTCFAKNDGEITVIVQGGTPEYTITWSDSQTGQTAYNIGDGKYDVVITDLNQCRIDTFGTITQPDKIKLSKEVSPPSCPDIADGVIQYQIQGGTTPYDLSLNGQNVNELVTDLSIGKYLLVVKDNNQCEYRDTTVMKEVSELCVKIPNAISPNGDGVNDTWIIDQIEIYPNVKIEIYNRWGELIYIAPKGYSKPWDGTYKGRELPIDSYYYVIDLKNGRSVITGNITIIR